MTLRNTIFSCVAAAIAAVLLLTPCARAAERPLFGAAKAEGTLARRVVGISSICCPRFNSLAQMENAIDTAAQDKPDLILLTEGCIQNAPESAGREEQDARAEPLPEFGPITRSLSAKAKQHHAYIIASYYRKAAKGPGRYNSAVLLDRQGKLAGFYDKTFPTIGEIESGILPGHGAVVFDTDFGRVGAMICFDLNFPELLAEYKQQRAELICFLSAFRGGKRVPSAAMQNECFIATSVPGENGLIVDPLGRTLAESGQYAAIIFARVNLDSRVAHIDYNVDRVRRMKQKYGPAVRVETFSPEAVYFIWLQPPPRATAHRASYPY